MCVYAFEVFESVMSVCIYVFVHSGTFGSVTKSDNKHRLSLKPTHSNAHTVSYWH